VNWILWAAAGVLLAVAAAAVWFAFSRPDFVLGLALAAAGALGKALAGSVGGQVAKDMVDPEVDRRNKEAAKHAGGQAHPGTGVTTGNVIKQPAATKRNHPKP
jgi:4-hydroxybenzoate polyprenyltransferase